MNTLNKKVAALVHIPPKLLKPSSKSMSNV